ncbi:MAG: NADP-dependent malic enzyme [Ilumatobacteraceae bacterium]|nr:NADP-dependent malic enzyme [Ilumatobacteraceae bacterium]
MTITNRPSAGYALTIILECSRAELGRATAAVLEAGCELTGLRPLADGSHELVVACSSSAHQDEVRRVLAEFGELCVRAISDRTFDRHVGGKIVVSPVAPLEDAADLAMAYTPGVGRVSRAIADDVEQVWTYTGRSNAVAVLSNGTAVLGLGDIGPEAAMPVMEGKAVLFKQFGGVDAYPVCIEARTVDEVVAVATALAPTFGGINLEDIKAPECFEIEQRLQEVLDIPVFHDDQHGTAIVTLAAVQNALRVVGKRLEDATVTIVGTGAAGVACAQLLHHVGVGDVIGVDSTGILHAGRAGLTPTKQWFVDHGNREGRTGGVREAIVGVDVLLGLSGPGVIEAEWLEEMADEAIVFAMANPVPEVMPELMPERVAVVATGRSDYANQINNVLAFPGVFRGMLDARATRCTVGMKLAAAAALAAFVPEPTADHIIPGVFEPGVADAVAEAVAKAAADDGVIRRR